MDRTWVIPWQVTQLPLNLFILFQTILWSIVSILLFLVESSGRLAHLYGARTWSRILLWACRVRVELRGAELLSSARRPLVLVSNHQSLFDILALLAALPLDFKFVVKKEIMAVPLWGQAMRRAGYICVDRSSPDRAREALKSAAERIRGGASVLFFAEGSRSPDGRLGPFKRGAFTLASLSGCDVLPLAIQGSDRVLDKKSWRIRPGRIRITILPPITDPTLKKSSKMLMSQVRQRILTLIPDGH